jgi:hypothetical protein
VPGSNGHRWPCTRFYLDALHTAPCTCGLEAGAVLAPVRRAAETLARGDGWEGSLTSVMGLQRGHYARQARNAVRAAADVDELDDLLARHQTIYPTSGHRLAERRCICGHRYRFRESVTAHQAAAVLAHLLRET